jgi:hypothetical protein
MSSSGASRSRRRSSTGARRRGTASRATSRRRRDRFIEVIEDELGGRRVLAFMSANDLDPDLLAELFVLEPEVTEGR